MNQKKKNTILATVAVVLLIAAAVIAYIQTRPPKVEEVPADVPQEEIRRNRATAPDFEMPKESLEGGN